METLTPAQVVEKTGFSLDTLRYYERIGLLEPIARNAAGQRRFSSDDVGWLGMLRCLRGTGMPIAEMLRFAELIRQGEHTIPERIELLVEHDRDVDEKLADLREKQSAVRNKISLYQRMV